MATTSVDSFAVHSTERLDGPSEYLIRKAKRSRDAQNDLDALEESSTLYIGNLSFFTTEEQIYELFSKAGLVKRIVMGLDRFHKTPCGFCFVEYESHLEALYGLRYLNQTKLDDRVIKVDLDPGFKEGRQYGRGASGGQVQDEFRYTYDPGRGGYGKRWDNAAVANNAEPGNMAVNYGVPFVGGGEINNSGGGNSNGNDEMAGVVVDNDEGERDRRESSVGV